MKCACSRVAEHQPVNAVRQRRTKLIGGRCSGRNQELKLSIEVAPRLVAAPRLQPRPSAQVRVQARAGRPAWAPRS